MHWKLYFIAALFAHITIAISGIENKPPTISYLATKFPVKETQLKGPADYVQIASNSAVSFVVNRMICRATNADAIKWQFKKEKKESFTDIDQSNDVITLGALKTLANNEVEMEINDGVHRTKVFLEKLNGYYRCVASNQDEKFVTLSATFRVILPHLVGTDVASSAAFGSRVQNQSYVLPCMITKTDIGGGYELKPADAALFDASAKFFWYRTYKEGTGQRREVLNLNAAERVGRVKLDPITGDLYFAYLTPYDQVTDSTGDSLLQCDTQVGESRPKTTTIVVQFTVEVATGPIPEFTLEKPTRNDVTGSHKLYTVKEDVECIAGKQCQITCIFGGIYGETGRIRGRREGDSFSKDGDLAGFSFLAEGAPETQTWQCELYDEGTDEIHVTVIYIVVIKNYPVLRSDENFKSERYVQTGTTVTFVCEAAYVDGFCTDFFFNGEKITSSYPKHIKYHPETDDLSLEIENVQKDHAGSFLCVATNEVGSLFVTSNLVVYDPPAILQYPLAENPYVIKDSNHSFETFYFNCSVTLDVQAEDVMPYWKSNRTGKAHEKIVAKDVGGGIKVVNVPKYVAGSGVLTTSLVLKLDSTSINIIRDTQWQCVVECSIFGRRVDFIKSDPVLLQIASYAPAAATAPLVQAFPHYPLIFGTIGGFLFLVLLIVLISCYVQKNKGKPDQEPADRTYTRPVKDDDEDHMYNTINEADIMLGVVDPPVSRPHADGVSESSATDPYLIYADPDDS